LAALLKTEGDGMDEPTDPLRRQLALSALTTEQFNLQTARMGTIAEANGRSTLYLGTLSSAVIAIAFVGQANELGDSFYLFALLLLPPVFLLGVFSYLRLVQTSIEDMVYALGSFRIRQYFLGLDPAALAFGYQVQRFRRAAAVVPQLYEGRSPGMPGWTERSGEREA
jgi:hypothetical protein